MKLLSFSAIMQLAIGIFSLGVAANSDYAASCQTIRLYPADNYDPHWLLFAYCQEPSGIYEGTELAIESCFANYNGNLAAALKYEHNAWL
jgi:hypothetical protein